jgi:hypothetical protein
MQHLKLLYESPQVPIVDDDSSSSSDQTMSVLMEIKDMRSALECPVCLHVRLGNRIFQCIRGHNICAMCKADKSIVVCPTCREGYHDPPARNFCAENLISTCDLEFPCQNASLGCQFRARRAPLLDHKDDCGSRKVPCPYSFCKKKVAAKEKIHHSLCSPGLELAVPLAYSSP